MKIVCQPVLATSLALAVTYIILAVTLTSTAQAQALSCGDVTFPNSIYVDTLNDQCATRANGGRNSSEFEINPQGNSFSVLFSSSAASISGMVCPGARQVTSNQVVQIDILPCNFSFRITQNGKFFDVTGTSVKPGIIQIQNVSVTVTTFNFPPVITGGATAAISVAENQTAVTDVDTTDDNDSEGSNLTYTLTGGADQGKFGIVASSGVLTFNTAPDFETPTDSGSNNVYDVQVIVTDSGALTDVQNIAVTVTDLDEIAPILAQVTPVPPLSNDTTPSYTFSSDEAGPITVGGDCSLGATNAAASNNTITFDALASGIHSNCTVTITDAAGNASAPLSVSSFTIDTGRPAAILSFPVSALSDSTNTTSLTIRFTEGVIGFDVSDLLVSGGTLTGFTSSSAQDYAVTFTATDGVEVTGSVSLAGFEFTDLAGNTSGRSAIANVTIDTLNPTLAEVTPVPTPTDDKTPSYTFSSDEAGTIGYDGDCSSPTTSATVGNNTITFNALLIGTHSNCTIIVTDAAGNASAPLSVTTFTTFKTELIVTTSNVPAITNAPFTATFTFQLKVTHPVFGISFSNPAIGDFIVGDITVGNGAPSNLNQLSGGVFTALITPAVDGDVTIDVAAGVVSSSGEDNIVAVQKIADFDGTEPTLLRFATYAPVSSPTNASNLVFLATFSEEVVNVGTNDFEVNGSTANVTMVSEANSSNYLVFVSGGDLAEFNGSVGLDVVANPSIEDGAGNALVTGEPATDEIFNVVNNSAPVITGDATVSVNASENQIAVTDVAATDDNDSEGSGLTYTITGGADQEKFDIVASTGVLTFKTAPDFETKADADGNGTYIVDVTVTDSGTLTDIQTITVTVTDEQAVQTISLTNPGAQTFVSGGTVPLTVSGGGSGNTITLTSTTMGVCTVTGSTVTMVSVGTCTITADQAAGNDFAAATQVVESFAIDQADQAIAFTKPGTQTFSTGGTVPLTATGGASGNGVTFTSNTAGVCTVAGSTVTIVSAGTCAIAADQAGNGNFNAAPQVVESFAIDQADQAIAFTNPGPQTFVAGGLVPLTATGGASGNGVTFTSNTAGNCMVAGSIVIMVSAGTCTIAADQAGNGSFSAASQEVESFVINQAEQIIAFINPGPQTFLAGGSVLLTATGGASGNGVTFTSNTAGVCTVAGSTATMVSAGTCTIAADQAGDGSFSAASQEVESFVINQAEQTIAFTNPGPQTFLAGGSVLLTATGGASGNGVTFTSNTAGVCTVAGSTVTMVTAGTCTIAADQAGNGNFNAAPQFVDSFVIDQADQAIAFTNPGAQTFSAGGTVPLTATGGASGNGVTFTSNTAGVCTVAGSTVTMVSAGTCTIAADQAGNGNFNAAPQVVESFAIDQGVNVIAFTGPADTDITAGTVSLAASASSGLAISFASTTAPVCTVAGTTVTLVSVGTCSITASQAGDANFVAAADVVQSFATTGDIVIAKTKAIISNFVSRRAGRILSGSPDIASRLRRTSGGGFSDATGFSPIGFSGSGTLENSKMAFSTSLRQVIGAGDASKKAQRRELGEMMALGEQSLLSQYNSGLQPGFDIWVKGSLDHATSDNRKSDLGLLFIGADYHVSSTTLVGVLAQLDWSDEQDTTNAISADGRGWMVGPYLATRLGKNLLFDGRAAYGQSSNNISPLGTYEDSFDTTRWLVSGTLTGDYNMGGWRFSPHVGVSYFEETQKAYTDSLNNTIAAQTISLGRMTFGPEVSTSFMAGNGTLISPHIGVKGIWDFEKAQTIDLNTGLAFGGDNDLRASIEAGITTQFTNGWQLAGEAHYDGIGDDSLEAYGGSVKLTVPFN